MLHLSCVLIFCSSSTAAYLIFVLHIFYLVSFVLAVKICDYFLQSALTLVFFFFLTLRCPVSKQEPDHAHVWIGLLYTLYVYFWIHFDEVKVRCRFLE